MIITSVSLSHVTLFSFCIPDRESRALFSVRTLTNSRVAYRFLMYSGCIVVYVRVQVGPGPAIPSDLAIKAAPEPHALARFFFFLRTMYS